MRHIVIKNITLIDKATIEDIDEESKEELYDSDLDELGL